MNIATTMGSVNSVKDVRVSDSVWSVKALQDWHRAIFPEYVGASPNNQLLYHHWRRSKALTSNFVCNLDVLWIVQIHNYNTVSALTLDQLIMMRGEVGEAKVSLSWEQVQFIQDSLAVANRIRYPAEHNQEPRQPPADPDEGQPPAGPEPERIEGPPGKA